MNKKILILISCACALQAGCYFYRPYYPYKNECQKWIGKVNHKTYMGMSPDQAITLMPNPQDRYEYYICVNSYMHPLTQKPDIFFPDAKQSATVAGNNINNSKNIHEIILTFDILYAIHVQKKYNVVSDSKLMDAIMGARSKLQGTNYLKIFDSEIKRMREFIFS